MTNKIKQAIDDNLAYIHREIEDKIKQSLNLGKLESRLLALQDQLSDEIDVNLYGNTYWITITNRDDLAPLLTLAPQWKKDTDTYGINYIAEVDGVSIHIKTRDNALPPTCRVVEIEVDVPARKEKRRMIQCDQPIERSPIDSLADMVDQPEVEETPLTTT